MIGASALCGSVPRLAVSKVVGVESNELEALASQIVEWAGHLAAGTASWLGMIARFDAAEGHVRWECQSCAHWLNWQCGLEMRAAREHVRVARRLTELPILRGAFERGEISYSKVRAITRVAEPETEGDLLMLAQHSTACPTGAHRRSLRAGRSPRQRRRRPRPATSPAASTWAGATTAR